MSNHELTGEPYLGITSYAHFRIPHSSRWDWIFHEHVVDERGREYWVTRKWPNMPFWLMTRARRKMRPALCRIGIHDRADISETDGSIWRAQCFGCEKLVKARRPHPPDAEKVAEWTKYDGLGEKFDAEMEAYYAGEGPCPYCDYPDGQHEYTCWEAD